MTDVAAPAQSPAVDYLNVHVPADLAAHLRAAFRDGRLRPVQAYAELHYAHVPLGSIDTLDVSQWLRWGATDPSKEA